MTVIRFSWLAGIGSAQFMTLQQHTAPIVHPQNIGSIARVCGVALAIVCLLTFKHSVFADEESKTAEHGGYVEPVLTESDRDHWSLKPLSHPQPPECSSDGWCRNEIDQFVASLLQERGLKPQPEADQRTLIRRVTLDITGLLPGADNVKAILLNKSSKAYEAEVDRLLATSAYGERYALYWLDLARFAETDGFEHDKIRPEAWKYRDWVIDALNLDVPYDEFIQLQIAGDLLHPNDEAAAVATHFCVCGPDMPDINLQEERKHTLLNEMTATVGEVVLGLQLGCAQCHDHKYDPISQADFYRMRSVFEPAVYLRKNVSVAGLSQKTPYQLASHLMLRGDFRRPGPEVQPGTLRVLDSELLQFRVAEHDSSNGHRVAFARWLTDPANPLTARVIVNRIWQQHFGIGLSDSPSDFGVMGQEPVNAGLLDWLATRFIEDRWSLKKLHRLILTSATFRQRSKLPSSCSAAVAKQWQQSLSGDPDCRLLSRFPRLRLQGEVIRDVMLQTAGILNRKAGGPGVRPPLPAELRGTLLKDQWNVTKDADEHNRRSIYVFARRNMRYPIFEAFDRPAANQSCAVRTMSTTAPQSLHLLNSEFSLKIARQIAQRLVRETPETNTLLTRAFEAILGRPPFAEELADVNRLLNSEADEGSRLTHLCLCLLNCNEFVFID